MQVSCEEGTANYFFFIFFNKKKKKNQRACGSEKKNKNWRLKEKEKKAYDELILSFLFFFFFFFFQFFLNDFAVAELTKTRYKRGMRSGHQLFFFYFFRLFQCVCRNARYSGSNTDSLSDHSHLKENAKTGHLGEAKGRIQEQSRKRMHSLCKKKEILGGKEKRLSKKKKVFYCCYCCSYLNKQYNTNGTNVIKEGNRDGKEQGNKQKEKLLTFAPPTPNVTRESCKSQLKQLSDKTAF